MTSYPSGDPGPAAVRTPLGTLVGQHVGHGADAVRVFRGVPYAVPPLGARGWKHAESVRGWRGERLAVAFGPECPQPPFPPDDFYYRPAPQASEDCLQLNVWAPAERDEPLPVMVWIHGGSLVEGAGSSPAYDGTARARKGVVVITINYRLGVFGFVAMVAASTMLGGNIRVGLEDNLYLSRGAFATNGQLMARARTISESMGYEVATPDQPPR